MKAHYLGHVVFYVKNLEKSLAFYRDLLGFELVGDFFRPFTAVALTAGRTHHEILLIQVGDAPGPPKGHRIGLYHIGIKVGDSLDELRAVRDELIESEIPISGMSDHTVSQSIYLEDPDGNEVEIYVDDPDVDWKNDPSLVMSPIRRLEL
ncbi:MAG: VOC family protein [Candidatus Marinimicrobia bacterium]|jgi:catechol 2,3-dioxygenase|nr:VOC family protein [Candidatus Neomarinimicrobiota bacterium]MBT3676070.1 VOC family protein [Candidatus Neomarinimicrobiota bacterium]MBT3762449.1 VOC family protein [Candidatus Neomarinimicrobiota bacterium]MBT4067484.1 VOC family protein [Candidatus Neomarinimicrobiota bacterium]MBT4271659.1 VOC family protein [Candidatus Neomarinimicrobiota bacterium]